ncbi:MAG: tRNA pseudouridine(55) synthase TruB [Thermodesulfobacteriota bacterium]
MKAKIDGLLVVDKPDGMTSLEVVKEIKRRFHVGKAGHIGTLDPFATGVLPVAINEGTKLIPFLEEEPKEYEGVMKLGEETTTDDLTGEIGYRGPWEHVTPEMVDHVFQEFSGKIRQVPPMFSALKVNGRPLYRLARKGIEIERGAREITIFNIRVEGMDLPRVRFNVACSKGTYIRALAKDIGRKLGCGAHLLSLRRVRSGPFSLQRAISWKGLVDLWKAEDLVPWLISLREALPRLPELIGDEHVVKKLRFGKKMVVRDLSPHPLPFFEKGQWLKLTSPEEGLVAILRSEVENSEIDGTDPDLVAFQPVRVFHPLKTAIH